MKSLTLVFSGALCLLCFIFVDYTLGVDTDEADLKLEVLKAVLRELINEEDKSVEENEEPRIIGGENMNEGDHPWLVSLKGEFSTSWLPFFKNKKVNCGGTLIKRRWVLTAAHCFVIKKIGKSSEDPDNWEARLGEIDRENSYFETAQNFIGQLIRHDDWRSWEIEGAKIIVHPDYDPEKTWLNDIALLKLDDAVPEEEMLVGQAHLPKNGDDSYPRPEDVCLAMGWGCKSNGGRISDVAQKVELKVLSNENCRSYWRQIKTDTRLCAGEYKGGKGICKGDSGGPLMCKRDNKWYLAGISSFSEANKPGNYPGVFTRVSSYVKWIEANTK